MEPKAALPVSARAWSELLHAEVAYLLREAGIPCLHIKGPTVALWLYEDDERPWGDVDILVPPAHMRAALALLGEKGMVEVFPGVNRDTTTDHAVTLARDPDGLLDAVDVHDRFPGLGGDPERVFSQLWRRREPAELGHVQLWFPDLPTRALLIALNTARSPTPQAKEDLRRLITAAEPQDWSSVIALARQVQALPGLRAGLELDPAGRTVVSDTALAETQVSPEWQLRLAGAPRTALRLEELGRLPWYRRASVIGRWLVPAPGILRMRDRRATGGTRWLAFAYLRRLGDGVRAVPPSLHALAVLRQQRRRARDAPPDRMQDSTS